MSRIITFYSYKGGVGRTFALANIGVLLAMREKRVLIMDWNLEAPGLDHYFDPYEREDQPPDKGIIQLLGDASTDPKADWRPHVRGIRLRAEGGSANYDLSFISSGIVAPDYAEQVRRFSWSAPEAVRTAADPRGYESALRGALQLRRAAAGPDPQLN